LESLAQIKAPPKTSYAVRLVPGGKIIGKDKILQKQRQQKSRIVKNVKKKNQWKQLFKI